MATINLPDNPDLMAAGELGKNILLYINIGTIAMPNFILVGGQRSNGIKRKADEIDMSNKTTGGWKTTASGLKSWTMDFESMLVLDDDGYKAIRLAFDTGKFINVKVEYSDKSAEVGWGSVTAFDLGTPHDGAATISGTISGIGELDKVEAE